MNRRDLARWLIMGVVAIGLAFVISECYHYHSQDRWAIPVAVVQLKHSCERWVAEGMKPGELLSHVRAGFASDSYRISVTRTDDAIATVRLMPDREPGVFIVTLPGQPEEALLELQPNGDGEWDEPGGHERWVKVTDQALIRRVNQIAGEVWVARN